MLDGKSIMEPDQGGTFTESPGYGSPKILAMLTVNHYIYAQKLFEIDAPRRA